MLEFFERLSINFFFFDYYLGNDSAERVFAFYPTEKWVPIEAPATIPTHHPDGIELLNEPLRLFYNSTDELTPAQLLDNNTDDPERGIAALPFQQVGSNTIVYFPVIRIFFRRWSLIRFALIRARHVLWLFI